MTYFLPPILVSVSALASWLDTHSGAVSAAATVVLVIITAYYAWQARKTVSQMHRQREADEENRLLSQRPFVYPESGISMSDGSTNLNWNEMSCRIGLCNAGLGVAVDLCAVLMAPSHLTERYTLWKAPPLPPRETGSEFVLWIGQTMVSGAVEIGGFTLAPPPGPSQQELVAGRSSIVDARLTLTYRDVFGRKHAAKFDYTRMERWEDAAFSNGIYFDLPHLDLQARTSTSATAELRAI